MRKFLFIFLVLLIGVVPALAWIHGIPSGGSGSINNLMVFQGGIEWPGMGTGATASPACPMGSGFPDDGCAGAPAPLTAAFRQPNAFQSGGYFNTVAATSANYMATNCGPSGTALCRPPWNVASVDYAIGNYTPALTTCTQTVWDGTCLLDPATSTATKWPGCTYTAAFNSTGGNLLQCGGSSFTGVLNHINLGTVGGHACTSVQFTNGGTTATTLLMDDFNFFNDSGACSFGGGNTNAILGSRLFTGGVTLSNYVMDGNYTQFTTTGCSTCTPNTLNNPSGAYSFGSSPLATLYGVVNHFSGHSISGGLGTTASYVQQFSLIQGWNNRGPNGHAEWYVGSQGLVGMPLVTIDHNVIVQEKGVAGFGPTPFFFADNYPMPIGALNFTNNTQIDAFLGGGTKNPTISGCMGQPPTGGTATNPTCAGGAGNTFYLTAVTGTAGYGMLLGAPNACTGSAILSTPIAGPWAPAGGLTILGEWFLDGFIGGQYAENGFTISGTCTNAVLSAQIASIGVAGTDAATPLGTTNFANNYVDVSSQNGAPGSQWVWNIGKVFADIAIASGTITTTGGVSTLTTGAVITPKIGTFVTAPTIAGCGGTNLGCPTIVSGSGTTWIITPAVTPVGPIAMTIVAPTWCTTPATFTGNIDMAALISSAALNQWSLTNYPTGASIGC